MAYKKFQLFLILRLLLVIACTSVAVILYSQFRQFFSSLLFTFLALIACAELLRFVIKAHKEMESMVHSLAVNDFSIRFKSTSKTSTPVQYWSNVLMQKFKTIYSEKEKNAELMHVVISHVPVGLICFKNMHECILLNPAAKELLSLEIILEHKHLLSRDPVLAELLLTLTSGQREHIKVTHHHNQLELAITRIDYTIGEEKFNLFTFENISTDLDRKETESWQHLMRVLNHEIVNSITPIVSLSESLNQAITLDDKSISTDEFAQAIAAIAKRSGSLLRFAAGYRTFTGISKPVPVRITLEPFLKQHIQLLGKTNAECISLLETKSPACVVCDEIHLGQIIVNLIKNAIEASRHQVDPKIIVEIFQEENHTGFIIQDNGEGMSDEVLGKVFVPYFTTKDTGQGIGLSLCRQLVLANKGRITIQSKPGLGTSVKVTF